MNLKPLSQFAAYLGLALISAAAAPAATLCGTFAAPTACSVTTSGNITYTYSNFLLGNATSSGGGTLFTAADFAIAVDTPGSTSSSIEVSVAPGRIFTSFFVNAGQTSGAILTFHLLVSSSTPGTTSLLQPFSASMLASSAGTGFATVQFTPASPVCQLSLSNQSDPCTLFLSSSNSVNAGMILNLIGGTGNAAVLRFSETFDASITPSSGVPEPSSIALCLAGAAALAYRRFHR